MTTSLVMAKGPDMTDDERYECVRLREAADFVYSVQTTGVYCRTTCAARLALQKNVAFHETPAAAERAGFRACKRCRPRDASQHEMQRRIVETAQRFIAESEEPPTLAAIALHVGLSRFHFRTIFTAQCGITPTAYALAHRTRRLRDNLRADATVTAAIANAGFSSSSRVYERLDDLIGMKPLAFARRGAGTTIRYAIRTCSLGCLLIAATERGICALALGDEPTALERDLRTSFARAAFVRTREAGVVAEESGDAEAAVAFDAFVDIVVAFVDSSHGRLDVPLDIRGTAFQQRVWRELRAIAPGATASYAEVARRMGAPTAARAVAKACASNTIAIAIPCHRVVKSDGGISGYRWGVARKRALLARERDDS